MAKFFKWLFLVLLILGGVAWWIWHPTPKENPSPNIPRPPISITVDKVEWRDVVNFNEFAGTVQSVITAQISARMVAHIQEIRVHAGALVNKGDILVRLDDGDIQAKIKQAQSSLAAAEATRAEAERDVARYQDLVKRNIESRQKLDQVETKAKNTALAVEAIRQQIVELQENLSYTEIKAPFGGVVIEKFAEQGDLASPSRILLSLQDPSRLRLEAPVSEQCARRIRLGDMVTAVIASADMELETRVGEIVPAIDPKSRSFLVRANLTTSQASLKPGMFGRLRFPCAPRKILAARKGNISTRGQMDLVFVVENNQAKLRIVRLGEESNGYVEILSGLKEGDQVVVSPPENLKDGDPVSVQEKRS